MAIAQAVTSSFKSEVLQGIHDLAVNGDTFKIALYNSSANLSSATVVYDPANEVSGGGYTTGGATLTNLGVSLSGTIAYSSWNNVSWANAGFSAAGALIYNASKGNKAVAVLNFGGTYTWSSTDTATVIFPPDTSTTAIIIFN